MATTRTKKGHGVICAVSTLELIFTKYGYHGLSRVLRLIIGAWEGDLNSFSANILNAVTRLIAVYGDTLNDEVFKEKLGAASVKQLVRAAKERRPGSMGVAEVMLLEYNGKKKSNSNRLFINQLYSREYSVFKTLDSVPDDCLMTKRAASMKLRFLKILMKDS